MQLNIAEIRDYTGTDDEFIIKLFDKFLQHIPDDISKLRQVTEARNWDDVKRVSHALLSSARIFSLKKIITLHESIERNCINNTPAEVPDMVREITALYEAVIPEMNELKKEMVN